MIPNIVRGSDPAGLVRYLFGKGRRNEHTDQHLVCASGDMFPSFDMDGKPAASYAEIGRRFDRRYRVRERKDDPFPPDMRGKNNPEREHGRKRVWHCSLAIKAGQGILTDQEWESVIRDYLMRMNIIDGDGDQGVTWLAVRHGLSANGNDHVRQGIAQRGRVHTPRAQGRLLHRPQAAQGEPPKTRSPTPARWSATGSRGAARTGGRNGSTPSSSATTCD